MTKIAHHPPWTKDRMIDNCMSANQYHGTRGGFCLLSYVDNSHMQTTFSHYYCGEAQSLLAMVCYFLVLITYFHRRRKKNERKQYWGMLQCIVECGNFIWLACQHLQSWNACSIVILCHDVMTWCAFFVVSWNEPAQVVLIGYPKQWKYIQREADTGRHIWNGNEELIGGCSGVLVEVMVAVRLTDRDTMVLVLFFRTKKYRGLRENRDFYFYPIF